MKAVAGQDRAVVLAGFRFAGAEMAMEGAAKAAAKVIGPKLKALGEDGEQRPIRHDFQIGDMMRRIAKLEEVTGTIEAPDFEDALWERARLAFYAADHGSENVKPGHPIRTKKEQQAFVSARKAWSRMLDAAGLKSNDKRGGATRTKEAAPQGETEDKPVQEQAPLATSRPAAFKWITETSGVMNAFTLRNKEHLPEKVILLVDQFRKDLFAALKD
jgi:hypothetical protein